MLRWDPLNKFLVRQSFDLIEGLWECEKHAVMLGCVCKVLLREEGATHLQNGETWIRAVIKYLYKKGMPPKEIHEDFMETLGKESPSYNKYSTVQWKNGQQSLSRGERALRMMDGLATPKMPPLMKMSRSCTPWLCVIGGEASKVGISFGQYNQSA